MKIYEEIEQLIGGTPLLRAHKLEAAEGARAKLIFKLERFNPAGSAKDRVAMFMLDSAEKEGKIHDGATIIEATSGNTGVGLAAICAKRGYKAIFTMPDTMSVERIKLLKGYGAQVVLTEGRLGMQGAIDKAEEINKSTPNSIIASQFDNPANIAAHYQTTGVEIYEDTDGKVDILVAGIGTGGTLSGCARYLKEKRADILVYGVEPASSPVITKGVSGAHKIQGIGANFLPENYKGEYVDEVLTATDEEAIEYAKKLARLEGVLVGISSGAAIAKAVMLAKREENAGKMIVAVLPDTGERYLSTQLFED